MPDSAAPQPDMTPSVTDAPDAPDAEFAAREAARNRRLAYRRALHVITDPAAPMVLRSRTDNAAAAALLQSHGLRSALFITSQPAGLALSPEEQEQRHSELLDALRPWPLLAGFRAGDGGDWPAEPGMLVLCDDEALYDEWLRRFGQEVALRVTDQGETELIQPPREPVLRRGRIFPGDELPVLARERFAGFPSHQRLCYYPSCGWGLLWAVMQLDADLFVFSDKDRRYSRWSSIQADFRRHGLPLELVARGSDFVQFRSAGKTGLLFWEDNNLVLDRLQRTGLTVHHFVGICDGCCEGGNYECVHDLPFVTRLLRVAADGMRYSTDHSRPLQGFQPPDGWGIFHTRKFLEHLALRDFPAPGYESQAPRSLPDDGYLPEASFDLQGVLVRPHRDGSLGNLQILPFGTEPTQLDLLRPFRTLAGRGILAEYRVRVVDRQLDLDWSLL